jgi:undecaprenyl-diphosphatase
MNLVHALILSVVEGITEFLPISSTGHMIIASTFLGIQEDEMVKLFTVAIQLGAILAVVALYWRRFVQVSIPFYRNIVIASIPAAILGLSFEKQIDRALGNPLVVVITMVLGGFILVGIDSWIVPPPDSETKPITPKASFVIGFFQCLAMIPGTSRSASTIIGGLTQKLTRRQAAEFSFFLAVPIMFGATGLKLWKGRHLLTPDSIQLLIICNVIAFVVAAVVIKAFIGYLSRHGLKAFGFYRIVAGATVFALLKWKGLL